MDSRIALAQGTRLRFQNKAGGAVVYTIVKEIARGGSSIVYDASYETNSGDLKFVRIKECYPSKLRIQREITGTLVPLANDEEAFCEVQGRFRSDFSLGNGLFYSEGLFDALTNTIDIYSGNGTAYLVSVFSPESTLAVWRPDDMKSIIAIVKQISHILHRIHKEGYIYLDIKPENVLVSDSYTTRVQLFDFDSLIPMSLLAAGNPQELQKLRLSYSKGYAAIELQTGKLRKIGIHTDVYGLGALFFYLLFGETPSAADCEPNAVYDFGRLAFKSEYKDKLYFSLADFFHHTLANFYLDRWNTMQQVIDALCVMETLADSAIPFIRSTVITAPGSMFGRQEELAALEQWFEQKEQNCLFVTGMGGIGKSTLIRSFLNQNKARFDSILYLSFDGTIPHTIGNDRTLSVSTVSKDESESFPDYYNRKLAALRSIVSDGNHIVVIDNYSGETGGDLLDLLSVGWRVVLISRAEPQSGDYAVLPIVAIQDRQDLYLLVENNLNRRLTVQEKPLLDVIIGRVAGHTLVLDLISKQIAASYLTVQEALELVSQHGFSDIAPEKVVLQKDGVASLDTIRGIITALFETEQLSENSKCLLKTMSLLPETGMDIRLLHTVLGIESKDNANALIRNGWLSIDGVALSMHPVVKETAHCWAWTETAADYAVRLMEYLFKELKLEGRKEDYPKGLLDTMTYSIAQFQRHPKLEKWFSRFTEKRGVLGETLKERYARSGEQTPTDREKLGVLLQLAEGVANSCMREPDIRQKSIYLDLLYCTVLNMPRYREDFILSQVQELLHNPNCQNGIALMRLHRCVLDIYTEHRLYNLARETLTAAEVTAKKLGHSHVLALYYDMLSDFYDCVLNGAYDAVTEDEAQLLRSMMSAIDKTIFYARRTRGPDAHKLLAKTLLAKATILIRSDPNKKKKIDKLMAEAKRIVIQESQPFAELRSHYYSVCSWYFTFIVPSLETAVSFMEQAKEIVHQTAPTDLDEIDDIVVPYADVLCNWGEYSAAVVLLMSAVDICERKCHILPYLRKKLDVCGCLLDVFYEWGRMDLCKALLAEIDKENERYAALGIRKEVSEELRKLIQSA